MDFTSQKVILGASGAGGASYIFQEFYVASGGQNNNYDSITFICLALDTKEDIYLGGYIRNKYYTS